MRTRIRTDYHLPIASDLGQNVLRAGPTVRLTRERLSLPLILVIQFGSARCPGESGSLSFRRVQARSTVDDLREKVDPRIGYDFHRVRTQLKGEETVLDSKPFMIVGKLCILIFELGGNVLHHVGSGR